MIPPRHIQCEAYLNLRYKGTDNLLMVLDPDDGDFISAFVREHQREFSFTFPGRPIVVEDMRVRGVGKSLAVPPESPQEELKSLKIQNIAPECQNDSAAVYFGPTGLVDAPVYFLKALDPGTLIRGPAIIIEETQTIVVEPFATATILSRHIILSVSVKTKDGGEESALAVDPIRLSVFGYRSMCVADQMSRMFQKTSVSTNIKVRLDFSCAVFSPDGKLVANAPNVPVHLGSEWVNPCG